MAQRFIDIEPDIDDLFTDLEQDLLRGAFLASRPDPLKFAYVSPFQCFSAGPLEPPNVASVKYFGLYSNAERVEDGALRRAQMMKRWIVLSDNAREAVERLWKALHAEEPEPAGPRGFWSRRSAAKTRIIVEISCAREDIRREVPLFCHHQTERLLTWLEMTMEGRRR